MRTPLIIGNIVNVRETFRMYLHCNTEISRNILGSTPIRVQISKCKCILTLHFLYSEPVFSCTRNFSREVTQSN